MSEAPEGGGARLLSSDHGPTLSIGLPTLHRDPPFRGAERMTLVPAVACQSSTCLRSGRGVLVILAHAFDAGVRSGRIVGHPFGVHGERFLALPVLEQHVRFGPQRAAEHFELQTARLVLSLLAALGGLGNSFVGDLGAIGGKLNQEANSGHGRDSTWCPDRSRAHRLGTSPPASRLLQSAVG